MSMRVIYVAHPLGHGADRETNRAAAAAWCGWIAETFNVAISADWIVLSGVWTEDKRDLGLATDMEMVSRADEVWQVGPRVSPGMALEGEQARKLGKVVRNLTGLTREQIITGTAIPHEFTPQITAGAVDASATPGPTAWGELAVTEVNVLAEFAVELAAIRAGAKPWEGQTKARPEWIQRGALALFSVLAIDSEDCQGTSGEAPKVEDRRASEPREAYQQSRPGEGGGGHNVSAAPDDSPGSKAGRTGEAAQISASPSASRESVSDPEDSVAAPVVCPHCGLRLGICMCDEEITDGAG